MLVAGFDEHGDGVLLTSDSITSQKKKYIFQEMAGRQLDDRGFQQRVFVSEIWTAEGDDNVPPSKSDSRSEGVMVIASDGERTLTGIMRVERNWQTAKPTVMNPEFAEGDARTMHPAMAIALGLANNVPDQPVLTDAAASEIAAECVASIDAQIEMVIANLDRDDISGSEFMAAITPRQPATLRVLEWLAAARREMKMVETKPGEGEIVLLATTIQAIADVLRDQGYNDEVRQMMDALERSDAAAQSH